MAKEKRTKPTHLRLTEENLYRLNQLCDELERDQSWVINKVLQIGFDGLELIKRHGRTL